MRHSPVPLATGVSTSVVAVGSTAEKRVSVKSVKPVTMWYQSGTSIRINTRHTNVGDPAGLCGGQLARAIVWGKRTLR
ncbi:hypothetical protein BHM03_00010891 [Ensete ventricosum]|nr:hypothetical protein BHM03_00010891 [Ensete ventricosum]